MDREAGLGLGCNWRKMRFTWGRKTIEDYINVLGITRGAKQEVLGPRSE